MDKLNCYDDGYSAIENTDTSGRYVVLDLRSMLSGVFANQEVAHDFDPSADCVGTISKEGKIHRAEVTPFWSHWSTGFLHSSDVVLAMSSLVAECLRPDELIVLVKRMRFHAPMRNSLDVQVQVVDDSENPQTFTPSNSQICFAASFQTSAGRTVMVQASSTANEVSRDRYWENRILADFKAGHTTRVSPLSVDGLDLVRPFNAIPGRLDLRYVDCTYPLSIVMDMFMGVGSQAHQRGLISAPGNVLLAGFENLQLPSSDDLLKGGTLYLRSCPKEAKALKNGSILPFDIQMRNTHLNRIAGGRMNLASVLKLK